MGEICSGRERLWLRTGEIRKFLLLYVIHSQKINSRAEREIHYSLICKEVDNDSNHSTYNRNKKTQIIYYICFISR